jgi:signal transduction histidine kinase
MILGGGRVILEEDMQSSARTMPPARSAVTVVRVNGLRQLRARVSEMDPLRVDAIVAAAFAVAIVVESALVGLDGGSRALTMVLGVAAAAPLAIRRTHTFAADGAFGLVLALQGVLDGGTLFDHVTGAFVALLLMLYTTGRHCPDRQLWPAVGALLSGMLVAFATSNDDFSPDDAIWITLLFGLPLIAGRAVRSRVLLQRELREKAARAESERADRARRAIEEERDRIAGELQAVVANGVSAMVIQAEAVPRLLASNDTASAELALAAVEETGRDALGEMRRLLGVLRREDEGLALAPQPGLARLRALIEHQRERGLVVELEVEGDERPLSTGVDLTAYRVLEDALQAAGRQRAERATVRLRYRDDDLQLEVCDDRSGGASARLPGLRDRVGLYGGHLSVGREDGVGFRLRAQLPLGEGMR